MTVSAPDRREGNVFNGAYHSYGATFAGWVFAALTSTHLCQYLDMGWMIVLGTAIQLVAHSLRAWFPPFGLLVFTFWLVAIGQAYNDTQANTFMASTRGAHRWLAVLHATFMAGCLVGPFVATGIASATSNVPTRRGVPPPPMSTRWYLFYIFPAGLSVVSLALISVAFRDRLRIKKKTVGTSPSVTTEEGIVEDEQVKASRNKNALQLIKSALRRPSVWLLSMFYFFYLGSQVTMNGWVVEYLVQVRDGDLAKMGFVPAGFNVRPLDFSLVKSTRLTNNSLDREAVCSGGCCWQNRHTVLVSEGWSSSIAVWPWGSN